MAQGIGPRSRLLADDGRNDGTILKARHARHYLEREIPVEVVVVSERYIVEFGREAYGILERQEGMLIFHATHERVSHLDGQRHPDVGAGRMAVERAARERAA